MQWMLPIHNHLKGTSTCTPEQKCYELSAHTHTHTHARTHTHTRTHAHAHTHKFLQAMDHKVHPDHKGAGNNGQLRQSICVSGGAASPSRSRPSRSSPPLSTLTTPTTTPTTYNHPHHHHGPQRHHTQVAPQARDAAPQKHLRHRQR